MHRISVKKKKNLYLLFAYEILLIPLSLTLKLDVLGYVFVSWIIPTIYFFYKIPTFRIRYIIEGLLWSVPMAVIIDYVGHYANSWSYWSNPLFAVTGITIGPLPLESYLWALAMWLFSIGIYEYFFERHRTHNFRLGEKAFSLIFTIIAFITISYIEKNNPVISNFYSWLLAFMMFLNILIFSYKKNLIKRLLVFGIISLLLGIIVEYTSLRLGLWTFPGSSSAAMFNFAGTPMPLEEMLWWIIIPMAIAGAHEVFSDTGD